MADAGQICNIACLRIVTDFLFPEEEDSLLEGNYDDTFVVLSSCCVVTRRKWARISRYFESTVAHYHCDVFRSHFRMTSSTFEMLSHFLSASDHIPKAYRFGKPCIHPRKQIAVAVWALANQESCRQISDRFDVTMSSVTRCLRRVTKALVDVRGDFIQWPRGRKVFLLNIGLSVSSLKQNKNCWTEGNNTSVDPLAWSFQFFMNHRKTQISGESFQKLIVAWGLPK